MRTLLYNIVDISFLIYMAMLCIRILSSWFPELQETRFLRFISFYTDPYLDIFRKLIPPLGVLDISPIVAFFALQIIESLIKLFLFS